MNVNIEIPLAIAATVGTFVGAAVRAHRATAATIVSDATVVGTRMSPNDKRQLLGDVRTALELEEEIQ